jgi:hypothetical protein
MHHPCSEEGMQKTDDIHTALVTDVPDSSTHELLESRRQTLQSEPMQRGPVWKL